MLGQRRAHEEAAVRPALDGEAIGRGVARLDEVLRASGEVVEHVLLVEELAGLVPLVAEPATATQIGDCQHHALLEEDVGGVLVVGFQGDVEDGDLDRVANCVRVAGFVNATPEFLDHSKVISGASELFFTVFGEAGRHTRIAVGVAGLPYGVAVEVEAIFAIAKRDR